MQDSFFTTLAWITDPAWIIGMMIVGAACLVSGFRGFATLSANAASFVGKLTLAGAGLVFVPIALINLYITLSPVEPHVYQGSSDCIREQIGNESEQPTYGDVGKAVRHCK